MNCIHPIAPAEEMLRLVPKAVSIALIAGQHARALGAEAVGVGGALVDRDQDRRDAGRGAARARDRGNREGRGRSGRSPAAGFFAFFFLSFLGAFGSLVGLGPARLLRPRGDAAAFFGGNRRGRKRGSLLEGGLRSRGDRGRRSRFGDRGRGRDGGRHNRCRGGGRGLARRFFRRAFGQRGRRGRDQHHHRDHQDSVEALHHPLTSVTTQSPLTCSISSRSSLVTPRRSSEALTV